MADDIALSLAARHVLQHGQDLQVSFRTKDFLQRMVVQMSASYNALQEAMRHSEHLIRKSGRNEDSLNAL